ncbi:4-nitrophenylphosphatase [Culex quinquefasciatus]|uniref:4-nitrophenylphosphatase n=1 Tax=Culex quinquefasciatus TaxID=7176 RepID=B0WUE5_CULQU|nr:4-nitrophenylphosphatase [Culex quinquefasciatus]|eukprot:XP_001858532.1 4-nitrophenylphosphatase [Culex quinquefasciatus]
MIAQDVAFGKVAGFQTLLVLTGGSKSLLFESNTWYSTLLSGLEESKKKFLPSNHHRIVRCVTQARHQRRRRSRIKRSSSVLGMDSL